MVEWTGFHPSGREDSALDSLILSLSPCSTDHSASFTVHLGLPWLYFVCLQNKDMDLFLGFVEMTKSSRHC
jgi:hypothetical protein